MLKAGLPFHRAIASGRGTAKGALRSALGRALKRTVLGGAPTLERAVEDEIAALPEGQQWVSSALRDYMLSTCESDEQDKEELLDKAFGSALESCRQAMKEAVSGLRVPVSAIFAMGIVLPIVVATMVPLWGMTHMESLASGLHAADAAAAGGLPSFLLAAPILAFPAICLLSALYLLSGREFVSKRLARATETKLLASFAAIGGATVSLAVLGIEIPLVAFVLVIIAAGCLMQRFFMSGADCCDESDLFERPSVLNAISSMLSSGEHFVRAAAKAAPESKETRRIFWSSVLPSADGHEEGHRLDQEMVGLITEATKKDPGLAAQILRQVARHLNELSTIEAEVKFELRPIAQSVLIATILLSPFVLGIAGGFGSLGAAAGGDPQRPSGIENMFAAFIAEMVTVGIWLVGCIDPGRGSFQAISERPAAALALSMAIFLATFWFSGAMFG